MDILAVIAGRPRLPAAVNPAWVVVHRLGRSTACRGQRALGKMAHECRGVPQLRRPELHGWVADHHRGYVINIQRTHNPRACLHAA